MRFRPVKALPVRCPEILWSLSISLLLTGCASAPPQDPNMPGPSGAAGGDPQSANGQPNGAPTDAPPPPAQWTPYASKDGTFSAQFPGAPEETVVPADGPSGKVDMHQFAFERPTGSAYMASYTDFPGAPATADQARQRLAAVRDAAVASAQAKLLDDKEINVNGIAGREFSTRMSIPETVTTRTRIFWKGGRLYQFMALVPSGLSEDGDVRHFLDSITLAP